MSYEGRLRNLKAAVAGRLPVYAVPASLALAIGLGALYFSGSRGAGASFPREPGQFMATRKAERRLSELSNRLAANPSDLQALAEAGRLKFGLGPERYVEAIADLEKARDLGLSDVASFYYLGVMYQAEGLYEFARREYERFLNNRPGDDEARMLLAKICYSSGDFPCAVREFEALLGKRPDDAVLLENLALSRWKNGQDHAPAVRRLRELGGAGAFLADQTEGAVAFENKDYPGAAALLRRAVEGAPSDYEGRPALLWQAADASFRSKDNPAARQALQELLGLQPAHEEGKALLAKVEKALRAEEKKKKKK